MPATYEIEVVENVTPMLDRLEAGTGDMTPAMALIARYLAEEMRQRFETGRAPDGTPWTPSERAKTQGGKTLVDRGDLVGSIREDWGKDYAAAGPSASGAAAVYARIHNDGGTIRARVGSALNTPFGPRAAVVMPKREYANFSPDDPAEIEALIADHLERRIGAPVTRSQ